MKLPSIFIRGIYRILKKAVADRRPPDLLIGDQDDPYLRRWYVIPRNPYFNVYLHNILKSDDDRAVHDHPWVNCSLLLKGSYQEVVASFTLYEGFVVEKDTVYQRREGEIIFRRAETSHRLIIPEGRSDTWTLFITGRNVRTWGFWCPNGWKPWQQFFEKSGCGEE